MRPEQQRGDGYAMLKRGKFILTLFVNDLMKTKAVCSRLIYVVKCDPTLSLIAENTITVNQTIFACDLIDFYFASYNDSQK